MRLVKAAEMKEIDRKAMTDYAIPGIILMEHAANALFQVIKEKFPSPVKTGVICGRGNNGGDGWALARLLLQAGWDVTVFHPGLGVALPPDAGQNREISLRLGVRAEDWETLLDAAENIQSYDLLIDALLGSGFRGQAEGDYGRLIELINSSGKPVIAVDLPSGLEADTGRVNGPVVKAGQTVTFGLPKIGLLAYPGRVFAGEIIIDHIGLPQQLLDKEHSKYFTYLPEEVKKMRPRRKAEAHKGSCGRLLVIGGSAGLTGAPVLTGMGALRSGAGLVTLGLRDGLLLTEKPPELMVKSWSHLHQEIETLGLGREYDAVIIGPGLSTALDGRELLLKVLTIENLIKVLDADALNIMSTVGEWWTKAKGPLVLTPHPGEMARLTGLSIAVVQKDRLAIAEEYAARWQAVVVLKGAGTTVASPEGLTYINPTGNPGLATGGTGDLLSGMIGAFLGQGLSPLEGACLGVYMHGAAADLAAEEVGYTGMIAGDVLFRLPRVLMGKFAKVGVDSVGGRYTLAPPVREDL
ncbi:MAG TPA: NAD(P)H-hydrate dehydratase [Firmicutes bacterium]|jgi:hydroxyethylthiazole kinase-like uncharacterized protein yjeF|nr:NAD(P)H-hydrate dehydratase [Bacillota bacterium]